MHLVTFVEVPVCHRFYGKIFWPPSLLFHKVADGILSCQV